MSGKISEKNVKLKRAYERPTDSDGKRVLVDRLWPRGVRKTDAAIDYWVKELAPSTELRKWFAHDPSRWEEFRRRYAAEIEAHREEFDRLRNRRLEVRSRSSRTTMPSFSGSACWHIDRMPHRCRERRRLTQDRGAACMTSGHAAPKQAGTRVSVAVYAACSARTAGFHPSLRLS
ncbi:DUF488 domain-containing protein [Sinorhizobium fredii]|uniref:DUF488 domain-containing protein n=1 Tax=Rhizobium fredii TaxID=380 RepID=UPI00351212FD